MTLELLDVGRAAKLAAGAGMVGLAILVWGLDLSNRVNRAFSLLILLRGLMIAFAPLHEWTAEESLRRTQIDVAQAIPFAAAYFALAYRQRYQGKPVHPAWFVLVFLLGLAWTAIWVLDIASAQAGNGPHALSFGVRLVSYAFVGLILLQPSHALVEPASRRAVILIAAAFAVNVAWNAARVLGAALLAALDEMGLSSIEFALPSGMALVDFILRALVAVPVLLILNRLSQIANEADPRTDAPPIRTLQRIIVGVGAGHFLLLPLHWVGPGSFRAADRFVDGLTLAFFVIVATYALLKHRVFDIDLRLQWTIRGGALGSLFIAAFLIAAQLTEVFAQEQLGSYGWAVGAAAAGLLLFALRPLERFAQRLAHKAIPDAKPLARLEADERVALYREQAGFAWADGSLTARERFRLDNLRRRLGLNEAIARRLEEDLRSSFAASA